MMVDADFWAALLEITLVNIVLSVDNAVVIALACRSLPPRQRRMAIVAGAGAAVVLRVILTVTITWLLAIPFMKFAGAIMLFWIGCKLPRPASEGDRDVAAASGLWQAVGIVMIADAMMSLDNVIAMAAISDGALAPLVLGLAISVPLVVVVASRLVRWSARFPATLTAGAAFVGFVAGQALVGEPVWRLWVEANAPFLFTVVPLLGAAAVVVVGALGRETGHSATQSGKVG